MVKMAAIKKTISAGLTVYHRFQSSTDMKKRFLIMEVVDVEKLCYAAKITHITRRWENTDVKFLIEPFKDKDIF